MAAASLFLWNPPSRSIVIAAAIPLAFAPPRLPTFAFTPGLEVETLDLMFWILQLYSSVRTLSDLSLAAKLPISPKGHSICCSAFQTPSIHPVAVVSSKRSLSLLLLLFLPFQLISALLLCEGWSIVMVFFTPNSPDNPTS